MRTALVLSLSILGLWGATPVRADPGSGIEYMMCTAKPAPECIIDAAIATVQEARKTDPTSLPFGRIVEVASRYNLIDRALSLSGDLDKHDSIAVVALVEAAARLGRLADVRPLLARLNYKEAVLAWAIGPALVQSGRHDEYAALIASAKPAPDVSTEASWRVVGHLLADRTTEATTILEALSEKDRVDAAMLASEYLLYVQSSLPVARHLLSYLPEDDLSLIQRRARIAAATKDGALAKSLLAQLPSVPAEDRRYDAQEVIRALAATGAWREAVELVNTLERKDRPAMLSIVAGLSAQMEVFGLVEASINAEPEEFQRNLMTRTMIRALVLAGYAPLTKPYIDGASNQSERETRMGFASAAMAEIGMVSDALAAAGSIDDASRRAWVLWEIADRMPR